MNASNHCTYRDHVITAHLIEHPGIPTPWAGGVHITAPDGHRTRRIPLPADAAFLAEEDNARRASIAHGRWLVDRSLDQGMRLG